jgi:hypothetical protein
MAQSSPLSHGRRWLLILFWLLAAAVTDHMPGQLSRKVSEVPVSPLSLVHHRPFTAQVESLTQEGIGFKFTLRATDGATCTFENECASPLESTLASHLQAGRFYAFPQCLLDILGEDALAVIRSYPTSPSVEFQFQPSPREVSDLAQSHPFRAVVLGQSVGEDDYSIVLQAVDSSLLHLAGSCKAAEVKRVVERLKRGEVFEFPAVLTDASEPGTPPGPKTEEARALACYIGEWQGRLDDNPKASVVMKCHWKADGKGIWREIIFDSGDDIHPPTTDIVLITYDNFGKRYLAADPAPDSAAPLPITWDEKKRAFTTTFFTGSSETRVNTATFVSADRIEWTSVTLAPNGQPSSATHGSYTRLSAMASAPNLPPEPAPGATPVLMPTVPTGKSSFRQGGHMASNSFQGSQKSLPARFPQLRELPPFRARITSLSIGLEEITTTIDRVDGRRYFVRHVPDADWDQACAIARRLVLGQTFEFPDVLGDNYNAPPANTPPSNTMRTLEPFVGDWIVRWETKPLKDISDPDRAVRYFWKGDGTGLWHEETTFKRCGQILLPIRVTSGLIVHDASTGNYCDITSEPGVEPKRCNTTWDAGSQTYIWQCTFDTPEAGTRISSTRHFVSRDRIEWKGQRTKADGTVLDAYSGHYERTGP